MYKLELTTSQTVKFWNEVTNAVDWDMVEIDNYLYNKYTIVKRRWTTHRTLLLSFEDEKYITWLQLYL